MPTLTVLRLEILVVGDAYGLLSLEVINSKRSRLFFR